MQRFPSLLLTAALLAAGGAVRAENASPPNEPSTEANESTDTLARVHEKPAEGDAAAATAPAPAAAAAAPEATATAPAAINAAPTAKIDEKADVAKKDDK